MRLEQTSLKREILEQVKSFAIFYYMLVHGMYFMTKTVQAVESTHCCW